jgi:hypothetical protein
MISGTRDYQETTFDAKDGRVELTRPFDYRPHLRFYALLGAGSTFRYLRDSDSVRSATFGDAGLGGQYDLGGPWSLNIETIGQLTHTFYGGIQLPLQQRSPFQTVSYLRFDARTALEWWFRRRFGAALAIGLGFGTPVDFADSHVVGDIQFSSLVELQPLIFTIFPHKLWFVAGAGTRLLEQHRNYVTDFTGSPTPLFQRDSQEYVFLRLRGALE